MATVPFTVKASIPQQEAFNRWYNNERCPQRLRYPGAVSARRCQAISGEDKYQRMADHALQDGATLARFPGSDHRVELKRDHETSFGAVAEPARMACVQVWP